ncbi:MAG: metallophosphoesterase [Alphaproteobacteria bacterium]|nr:metallophosphoesterase [Alphaproteobacteria bacterium]
MSPRLLAISDLHVGSRRNQDALQHLPPPSDDWLIVAGDVGESLSQLAWTWDRLVPRFGRVLWVPGNHELWSLADSDRHLRGEARYDALVELCRAHGVLTPEDPWALFEGQGGPARIALCFTLYDYSFRPDEIDRDAVLAWAAEDGIRARDESLLHPDPHPRRDDWCAARVAATEARLAAWDDGPEITRVLVNHWPLRDDLVRIPKVPRYRPWCGTTATADWHRRFALDVVVTGHLHVRATDWRDGTRFEEVSLGYPRQWRPEARASDYLREILRDEPAPPGGRGGPEWKRWR